MIVDGYSPVAAKRRRFTTINSMEPEESKTKLAAIKEKFGRDLAVFETSASSSSVDQVSNDEETDDFYEFTAEDYYRVMATKKEDKYLKTRKIQEEEAAACRSRITKAVIRVRFPDNHTLEVTFHPSEKLQSLFDIIGKVVARPELPFYLYTTPPKRQIKDLSQDFFSAGFIPGAIVHFSYNILKGDDSAAVNSGPFLQDEIMSLKGINVTAGSPEPVQYVPEPVIAAPPTVSQEPKPAQKKPIKPKWLKM